MSVAAAAVTALVVAIIVSCVTTVNVGVLAVALAWIVGVFIGKMPINTVMSGFPGQLFLTLAGVTLLFTLAQCNGTLDRLTHYAVRLCRGNRGVIPIMFFTLAVSVASIGPGNIATAALLAPMAMATAGRVGIPLFLMAIMVGNGANAGSLSPFAPTGIIVNGIMDRNGMGGFAGRTYVYNLLAHALVAFGGYFLFGGWKLFSRGSVAAVESNEPQFEQLPLEPRHWATLAAITTLVLSVIFGPRLFGVDVNVGMGAFAAAALLVLFKCGDDRDAIRRMPWGVIVMVSGVTVLISVLEKAEGIDLLVSWLARIATPKLVTGEVALLTGLVSVYSSTSGVVLPAFLPMVPKLAAQLGSTNLLGLASSMNIGGHLVDVSPLSTIGALCIAAAASPTDSRNLFNKMLAWGLSMSVVGGVLCYLLF